MKENFEGSDIAKLKEEIIPLEAEATKLMEEIEEIKIAQRAKASVIKVYEIIKIPMNEEIITKNLEKLEKELTKKLREMQLMRIYIAAEESTEKLSEEEKDELLEKFPGVMSWLKQNKEDTEKKYEDDLISFYPKNHVICMENKSSYHNLTINTYYKDINDLFTFKVVYYNYDDYDEVTNQRPYEEPSLFEKLRNLFLQIKVLLKREEKIIL